MGNMQSCWVLGNVKESEVIGGDFKLKEEDLWNKIIWYEEEVEVRTTTPTPLPQVEKVKEIKFTRWGKDFDKIIPLEIRDAFEGKVKNSKHLKNKELLESKSRTLVYLDSDRIYYGKFLKNSKDEHVITGDGFLMQKENKNQNHGDILKGGSFTDGFMNGYGFVIDLSNNKIWIGNFKNDRLEGKGEQYTFVEFVSAFNYERPSNFDLSKSDVYDHYEGFFKAGLYSGEGVMNYASKDKYSGTWRSGQYHGKGVLTSHIDENLKYEGNFKDGKKSGNGEQLFISGNRYYGNWENDTMTGNGTIIDKNGAKTEGIFFNNKINIKKQKNSHARNASQVIILENTSS